MNYAKASNTEYPGVEIWAKKHGHHRSGVKVCVRSCWSLRSAGQATDMYIAMQRAIEAAIDLATLTRMK
jgi:hypothetical protein